MRPQPCQATVLMPYQKWTISLLFAAPPVHMPPYSALHGLVCHEVLCLMVLQHENIAAAMHAFQAQAYGSIYNISKCTVKEATGNCHAQSHELAIAEVSMTLPSYCRTDLPLT